ncbi:MAG: manganese oxidase [Acidobacteriota bacterium]|nr:manganese oxidase [Acidobacteriota bacterium]
MKGHRRSGTRPKLFSTMLVLLGLLVLASNPALAQRLTAKNHLPFSSTGDGDSLSYLNHGGDLRLPGDTTADLYHETGRDAGDAKANEPTPVATTSKTAKTETAKAAPTTEAGATNLAAAPTTTAPATTTTTTSAPTAATTTTATTTAAVVQNPIPAAMCNRTITANVVALDQLYTYNRFGAFNPAGMLYALRRDVTTIDANKDSLVGNVRLRAGKRPRPLVLRVNEGDCLTVNFTNLLTPSRTEIDQINTANGTSRLGYFDKPPFLIPAEGTPSYDLSQNKLRKLADGKVNVVDENGNVVQDGNIKLQKEDTPVTRAASMHVNGMEYLNIASDGANVGNNASSLAAPGETKIYQWYARKQGQYLMYSMGTVAGGEGDGGQLDLGLFGSVNVEPRGSKWYRSQVTAAQLTSVKTGTNPNGTPQINYDKLGTDNLPILGMLSASNEIIYSDLNAIISNFGENCENAPPTGTCGEAFREFTVIFHDETKTVQAFPELNQELFHGVRDGFAINYGSGGLGAELLAVHKKVGPAANCPDCAFEEFFLESWANGDPAMNVRKDATGKAVEALFPDDPSNVHHSYMGDPVRFRNLHAGPKETHVFHLHAHQWLHESREDGSTYLDSQTIGPGGAFTYEINYGGSGNRNLTVGDSIFHCHLYPHFAQGMWELWRSHDVFESGTIDRNLPDAEIAGGTPNPAIIPLPNKPMPPMPTTDFKGYPFYVAAQPGHRAPQPPLDIDFDGGLPRHRILEAAHVTGKAAVPAAALADPVAARVLSLNKDPNLLAFAHELTSAKIEILPQAGTVEEKKAMDFHQGLLNSGLITGGVAATTPAGWQGAAYPSYTASGVAGKFFVNGRAPKPGAPFADPCPDTFTDGAGSLRKVPARDYRAAYVQFDMTVNRAGWHDRQARIMVLEQDVTATLNGTRAPEPLFFRANSGDCITFKATNLVPKALNLDDFQVYTPTDIIGQHIHLVKFDVTSSDGAANGWNYEDGTFAPDAVRERITANNTYQQSIGGTQILTAKTHPAFGTGPNGAWLGAQTTTQRWWADPLVNRSGEDRTIRTVFTHDHFGPSSHQHHGLYAALVVEPTDSVWQAFDGSYLGTRPDGGPTSYKANIIYDTPYTYDYSPSYREFNLALADFAIVYTKELTPVNPPGRKEVGLPNIVAPPDIPQPESISADDPGTSLINYRNEPIPLRVRDPNTNAPYTDARGNMANVFRSQTEAGAKIHGDPFTPLLEAYEGDLIQVRLIQGAQEEQHVFNLHGGKWLHEPSVPNSGYYNGQAIGISEHFEFVLPPIPAVGNIRGGNPDVADFMYSSGATDNLWDGMWGILRSYRGTRPGVAPLPSKLSGEVSSSDPGLRSDFCPSFSTKKTFYVEARLASDVSPGGIIYNKKFGLTDPAGVVFLQSGDVAAVKAGTKKLEPLVLRANAGDCINVQLTNNLPAVLPDYPAWNFMPMIVQNFNLNSLKPSNEVSLHPQLLEYDVRTSDGANVGINDRQTVAPGEKTMYRWYAGRVEVSPDGVRTATPIEYGAINLTDYGDIMKHGSHGAVGMIVIEPAGATWTTPANSNQEAVVKDATGNVLYKEFNVLYQDDLVMKAPNGNPVRNYTGDEDSEDSGTKGFNYKSEPIWARLGFMAEMSKIDHTTFQDVSALLNDVNQANVLSSAVHGDPETPVFSAAAGMPVRFRVVQPTGHSRQHAFTVHGHSWFHEAWVDNSTVLWRPGVDPEPTSMNVGSQGGHTARRHWNIILPSAGGGFRQPGDYLMRTQESFHFTSGLWGIFRVTAAQ